MARARPKPTRACEVPGLYLGLPTFTGTMISYYFLYLARPLSPHCREAEIRLLTRIWRQLGNEARTIRPSASAPKSL